jgi:hypothetical protein
MTNATKFFKEQTKQAQPKEQPKQEQPKQEQPKQEQQSQHEDQKGDLKVQKEQWLNSTSKHIFVVSEVDVRSGETKEIGYCRTRAEADHLIYDWGMKKLNEHVKYRDLAHKGRYNVSYAYLVEGEATRFEVREKSLGYIYDGPKVTRFVVKFTKLYRSYNSILSPSELENLKKKNEEKE